MVESLKDLLKAIIDKTKSIKFIIVVDDNGNVLAYEFNERFSKLNKDIGALSVSALAIYGSLQVAGNDLEIGDPQIVLTRYNNGTVAIVSMSREEGARIVIIVASTETPLGLLKYIAEYILEAM